MEKTYIKIAYKGKLTNNIKKENIKGAKFVYKGKVTKKYNKNICNILIKDAINNGVSIKKGIGGYVIKDKEFLIIEKRKLDDIKIRTFKKRRLAAIITTASILAGFISLNEVMKKKKNETLIEPTSTISTIDINENKEKTEEKIYIIKHEGINIEDKCAYDNLKKKYIRAIAEYSYIYGLDTNLVLAVLTQENKNEVKNDDLIGGHGIAQIEGPVWNGNTIVAYNFVKKEYEESEPIDIFRCDEDPEYCIKIACMILNNHYNVIHNNYSNKFTPEEEVQVTLIAYNKGIGTTEEQIAKSNNFEEFSKNMIGTPGGDDEYLHKVLSFIYNDDVITMKTDDNNEYTMQIINTAGDSINNEKSSFDIEDDYIASDGNSYKKRPHK